MGADDAFKGDVVNERRTGSTALGRQRRDPLAVDLDGTLIASDTLRETLIVIVKQRPWLLPRTIWTLRKGKAAFKRRVAMSHSIDPSSLPYNSALLEYLRTEHLSGRMIGLFTAADQSVADAVAGHLDLFDAVHGSDSDTNLAGAAKAAAIQIALGPRSSMRATARRTSLSSRGQKA